MVDLGVDLLLVDTRSVCVRTDGKLSMVQGTQGLRRRLWCVFASVSLFVKFRSEGHRLVALRRICESVLHTQLYSLFVFSFSSSYSSSFCLLLRHVFLLLPFVRYFSVLLLLTRCVSFLFFIFLFFYSSPVSFFFVLSSSFLFASSSCSSCFSTSFSSSLFSVLLIRCVSFLDHFLLFSLSLSFFFVVIFLNDPCFPSSFFSILVFFVLSFFFLFASSSYSSFFFPLLLRLCFPLVIFSLSPLHSSPSFLVLVLFFFFFFVFFVISFLVPFLSSSSSSRFSPSSCFSHSCLAFS